MTILSSIHVAKLVDHKLQAHDVLANYFMNTHHLAERLGTGGNAACLVRCIPPVGDHAEAGKAQLAGARPRRSKRRSPGRGTY